MSEAKVVHFNIDTGIENRKHEVKHRSQKLTYLNIRNQIEQNHKKYKKGKVAESKNLTHLNICERIEKIHIKKINTRQSSQSGNLPKLTLVDELKKRCAKIQKNTQKRGIFSFFFRFFRFF